MSLELPDGVTYNRRGEDLSEIYVPYEVVNAWNCDKCNLQLEVTLLGENGRFEGTIKNLGSEKLLWHGKLPKDENKAKKHLQDSFNQRINKHKGLH